MESFNLKSSHFRKEREKSWRELDRIVGEIERRGIHRLSPSDLHKLPGLYRSAVSSLSVARAISLDRGLLDYLEGLVSRAYLVVYSSKRPAGQVVGEFFKHRFPRTFFQYRHLFAVASILLALGTLCGFMLTASDLERYHSFVPLAMSQGRTPDSSTNELEAILYDGGDDVRGLTVFASFLFTHNAQVGILCFALGLVAGIPTAILLFYNGLALGAMTALYTSRGLGSEFLAWVCGHGVTELGAVCIAGAAGLALGGAMLFPGEHSRVDSLKLHGRQVALLVVGSVVMFFLAALLEGYFRQLVALESVRWLVALSTLVLWSVYFFVIGRRLASGADVGGLR